MVGNVSTRAESARAAVADTLREGACLSFPVPVMWDGSLSDGFFTFSVSMRGMVPYPANDYRIVLGDGTVVIERDAFGIQHVPFDTSGDVYPEAWEDSYEMVYASYDKAFSELERGEVGAACDAYVSAVRSATLASQMPYYQALNPLLFCETSAECG